jgi:hypothetical protein
MLAFVIGSVCLIALLLTVGLRALFIVPAAFVVQGLLMFSLEHLDGYWMPLPLDVLVGTASWAGTFLVVSHVGRRRARAANARDQMS